MAESRWSRVVLLLMMIVPVAVGTASQAEEKRVIGWLEKIHLPEYGFYVRAKMDTGAKNSSIHAVDVEYVDQQGTSSLPRIRFRTLDIQGKPRVLEADVLRQVRIKNPGSPTETRPEVEFDICLAGIRKRIRVNLMDRRGMNYRMILGRTALAGDFVVDPARKFTIK